MALIDVFARLQPWSNYISSREQIPLAGRSAVKDHLIGLLFHVPVAGVPTDEFFHGMSLRVLLAFRLVD